MTTNIKKGKYQHYKNKKFYEVIAIALDHETQEEIVVYRALYDDNQLWVRPKLMFLENVNHNGVVVPRFKFIEDK